jgi:Protein of unknown function (DUF2854)
MSLFYKVPLGTLLLALGTVLTTIGFAAYYFDLATLNMVGFFYGIPLVLGGFALRTSELKPVPFSQPTSPTVLELRAKTATQVQNKLISDLTRYNYGQDLHLDEALKKVGLNPRADLCPRVTALREEMRDGGYTLVLEFESPGVTLDKWQEQQPKIEKYFGPGIRAEIEQLAENQLELALVTL